MFSNNVLILIMRSLNDSRKKCGGGLRITVLEALNNGKCYFENVCCVHCSVEPEEVAKSLEPIEKPPPHVSALFELLVPFILVFFRFQSGFDARLNGFRKGIVRTGWNHGRFVLVSDRIFALVLSLVDFSESVLSNAVRKLDCLVRFQFSRQNIVGQVLASANLITIFSWNRKDQF